MPSLNKALIVGHLGRDPEVNYTKQGKAVCNFSVATTERWKGKDGKKGEKTEWHKIVAWGPQAEFAQKYLKKGALVYVEGRIETRKWEDGGVKRSVTEIIASDVRALGGKPSEGEHDTEPTRTEAPSVSSQEAVQDDIPF